ncbi:aminotransferase class III-fold pyridoxal phosphate-dependent enzyme [Iocasia frigidifontis]|uniref:Aminotransferase class III-fold pyridoxal phosphate-dependent enzyme n=1 Tax=Iocasia fonsfrigidae TaxID=2682810 RepID=A0A8A7KCW7_9FIRM|nr:aminotransferase class III-fold pyridoxal phosphate-dependent enzyme [Iocasia fonsfrigidae]QTL99100.1 aminotransferase class III-fold pyridoxal phosphate-dependent enzyme [Iocasia fonsfrigidae]
MSEVGKLNLEKSMSEVARGYELTPGAVLGIRRPYNFVEGEYPNYFESGKGSRIIDLDGNEYIDYLCAYGPIIMGYCEEEIDEAVIKQIRDKGFCFSLTQSIQNRLAEKMVEIIPSAEQVIFLKTGSAAATLAVRLARGYTDKTKIMRCGYHGWHDWCVEVKGGIPEKLYEDVYSFKYNDLASLEELLFEHGNDTAAIIITPVGHPLGNKIEEPKPGFLEGVRELADKYNTILIFDEIRTGFRVALGGAQEYYGVTPDLSLFGKAMANGYAIAAVAGKKEVMKKAEHDVFVSSTFFPNSLSFAAALKTIELLQSKKVLEYIWEKGSKFLEDIKALTAKYPVGAEVSGIPPMPYITFQRDKAKTYKEKRTDFYTQLIRRRVFMQPYHHGYICYRHTDEDLNYTVKAIEESLVYIEEKDY